VFVGFVAWCSEACERLNKMNHKKKKNLHGVGGPFAGPIWKLSLLVCGMEGMDGDIKKNSK
jgi:hypothetical protein